MKVAIAVTCTTIFLLNGCAGAPVGWGGTDEIVFVDRDTIKIQWDNLTTSEDVVRQKAVAHCAKTNRGITLVDASSDAFTFGLVRSRTWRCTGEAASPPSTTNPFNAPASAIGDPAYNQQMNRKVEAPPKPAASMGKFEIEVEQLAKSVQCHTTPTATLSASGPGFETYSVPCSNGDALTVRCESGNCRALK